jgi:hypothetical protein
MERELWRIVSGEITAVDRRFPRGRYTHSVGRVVRVYLWSVLNDRPVDWACRRENWRGMRPPVTLPDQSRMSRRLRQDDTRTFLNELVQRLIGVGEPELVKLLDGKPLPVSRHSRDPDATFGWGAGGVDKGYRLHAIYGGSGSLLAWQVHPLNVDERTVAVTIVEELSGEGYLLADSKYDAAPIYDAAYANGHQLVAPRRAGGGKGLGHRRQSPQRLRSISMLEGPSDFGRNLFDMRRQIETRFGNLCSFGGGLTCLPAWVRTLPRVRLYVTAKILIRAARNIVIRRRAA